MDDGSIPVLTIPGSGDLGPLIGRTVHHVLDVIPWIEASAVWFVKFLVVLSFPVSLVFLIGIIYVVEQLKIIKKKEALKYDVKVEPAFVDTTAGKGATHDFTMRWKRLLDLLNSGNENDWKQAIIQADMMLQEMLAGLGYQGDGVGEMLKRVEAGEMKTLQTAWKAHIMRNTVAHESGHVLDHHTAVQTMHQFREVFEEFYYI
ncbi:MAG TPA: hypothetical protein VF438_00185 [Candidatus Paceibacterota bacterium]